MPSSGAEINTVIQRAWLPSSTTVEVSMVLFFS